jgi:hypothetical protein
MTKYFRFGVRVLVAVLVIIQLTFLVKFLSRLVGQGVQPALSYIRGDYVAVQSSQGTTATLRLIEQPHPYVFFGIIAACVMSATLGLLWLDRRLGSGARPGRSH